MKRKPWEQMAFVLFRDESRGIVPKRPETMVFAWGRVWLRAASCCSRRGAKACGAYLHS